MTRIMTLSRLSTILSLLAALSPSARSQTTWYVDGNQPPPGSGTLSDPYSSVQYAIDQGTTLPGDTIEVFAGVYLENLNFLGKSLALVSRDGPASTILDGGGQDTVVRLENGEGPGTRIEGFSIRGGFGQLEADQFTYGGGLRVIGAEVELRSCDIHENFAEFGGGAYVESADVRLVNCVLRDHDCGWGLDARSSTVNLVSTSIHDNQSSGFGCDHLMGGGLATTDCQTSLND
jgi:hypothetical protein